MQDLDHIAQEARNLQNRIAAANEVDERLTRASLVTLFGQVEALAVHLQNHQHQHRLGRYGHA